jgi:formylglycine-generating enzyme required for sulfatase activity
MHPEWLPEWPAIGVSYEDAEAYCAWWTRRARERGETWTARLPTLDDWIKASEPHASRQYVFGNRFHPKWVSSCFARPRAAPEPVMSYPRDESVYGVFDLSGSVREWTDSWWDREVGLRRLSGGTWALPQREFFEVWGGIGGDPRAAGDENGFRLVLIPDETGADDARDE